MPRLLPAIARQVLTAGAVAVLLVSVPSQLAAVEKETATAKPATALTWLSGLWSDLAAWLAGAELAPPPQPELPSENDLDNGCAPDPHGGCGG